MIVVCTLNVICNFIKKREEKKLQLEVLLIVQVEVASVAFHCLFVVIISHFFQF